MWCVIGPVIALRRPAMTIDPRGGAGDHLPHRVPHGHGRLAAGWRPQRRAAIHKYGTYVHVLVLLEPRYQGTKVQGTKVQGTKVAVLGR